MGSEAWVRALWVQPFLDYSRSLGASTELQLGESGIEELRGAPGIPCPSRFMFAVIDRAIRAGEEALRATALQLRDETDVNTLAAYYHFFVREVRQRSAELLSGAEGVSAHAEPM